MLAVKSLVNSDVIRNKAGRLIALSVSLLTSLCLSTSALATDSTTIAVDLADASIAKHEIAVLQVLSEICPAMLPEPQRPAFYKAYNAELHSLMPEIEDPKAALQYLSTQQDYRTVLSSMRTWTMGFSREENLALCQDLANAYQ